VPKITKLSKFVKVMQRKLLASFYPDTVYTAKFLTASTADSLIRPPRPIQKTRHCRI